MCVVLGRNCTCKTLCPIENTTTPWKRPCYACGSPMWLWLLMLSWTNVWSKHKCSTVYLIQTQIEQSIKFYSGWQFTPKVPAIFLYHSLFPWCLGDIWIRLMPMYAQNKWYFYGQRGPSVHLALCINTLNKATLCVFFVGFPPCTYLRFGRAASPMRPLRRWF